MSTTGLTVPAGYPQEATLVGRELGSLSLLTGGLFVIARGVVRRSLVVAACALTFVEAGCSPSDPPPPPTPTPSATPTETAQEREQRLAYAAAETSYREFRAEVERVYARGGATKPTTTMMATAGGPYLKYYEEVSEAYHGLRHHSAGRLIISYVRPSGYAPTELVLDVCENGENVSTYDAKGKKLYNDDVRQIRLTVRHTGGAWKVWSGTGKKVSSCV